MEVFIIRQSCMLIRSNVNFFELIFSIHFLRFCFQGIEKGCIGNKWARWLNNNFMAVTDTAVIDGSSTESNIKEVHLEITIDRELDFDDRVNDLCKKASQKLIALACIEPFMKVDRRRIITKAFIKSQFGFPSFGCFIVLTINIFLRKISKIFLKKISLQQYTIEILEILQLKHTTFCKAFPRIFYFVE